MSRGGDHVGPSSRPPKSERKRHCELVMGLGAAVAVGIVTGCLVVLWTALWTNRGSNTRVPDPSVVIGTIITLYVLFIGGFGSLVGFITGRRVGLFLKTMAIALMVSAAMLDLWRVEDSTGDLYKAATNGLSYRQLGDDVHDFKQYFLVNVFVVTFAIAVACWRASPRQSRRRDAAA